MAKKPAATKKSLPKKGFLKERRQAVAERYRSFLRRRPHRSFKKTYRRDLPKPTPIPGYFAFTAYVLTAIKRYRKGFVGFLLLYFIIATLLVGIGSQEQYQELSDALQAVGPEIMGGKFDSLAQATGLFGVAVTGGLSGAVTEAQQLSLTLLGLFAWLAIVWYLRHQLAGTDVKVRDALYNSGAPFVSTFVVAFILALQFLPGALGILIYSVAQASGILAGGVEAMMFAIAALLLVVLSLYWATATFFAALIVTVPGTYPMNAMRMAGDIVLGRRLSVTLRLLWLLLVIVFVWAVLLIPIILINSAIGIAWLPLVPVTIQLLSGFSVIFGAAYIYLLYRKMIDEPKS